MLRLLILGAHPDDAEIHTGGLAAFYRQAGHAVKMVSVTDGAVGHHQTTGPALTARRSAEAAAAAALIGAISEVWDFPDGHLLPTLELRHRLIREIRSFAPDLVLTHRSNDYHPDHRAVGQAVQDASYLVTVPAIVPDVPILRRDPVVMYMPDRFTRPAPLVADVVVDVDAVFPTIVDMVACHASQVFEWLPFNQQWPPLPADPVARRVWLSRWMLERAAALVARYRPQLIATYGSARGAKIQAAEVYEASEYAAPLDDVARTRLFGFLR